MRTFLALATGATLGALLRYYVTLWAVARFGSTFPYGTLLVNLAGSLLLGFVLALSAARSDLSPTVRLFIATGFCGSLTTFSTFSYETLSLFERGNLAAAALNAFGSMGAGLAAVFLGAALARALG